MKITGYSTALFSTWYFVDELGLLFDCGDGVSALLHQKARKVKHVFISHADRDHLGGLFQFLQLNAREGFPKVYYPAGCGSFPAMDDFLRKFDPHIAQVEWIAVNDGDSLQVGRDVWVEAIENDHVVRKPGDGVKSLSYRVERRKRKLKSEFAGVAGAELGKLRQEHGEDHITTTVAEQILGFSADTTPIADGRWDELHTLIHEATFLNKADVEAHGNLHSALDEVFALVAKRRVKKLILGHFSARYSHAQIKEAVAKEVARHGITIPVELVLPGELWTG